MKIPAFYSETERLILRSFQPTDLAAFTAYRSDPEVARYQGWDAPYPDAKAQEFIEEMQAKTPGTPGQWYQVALERKSAPGLIGDCAFHVLEDGRQAEIGFTLAQAYQGQGYAAEAGRRLLQYLFAELHLHRVTATADAKNLASIRLLERLGLRREGTFIENTFFKGSWGSEVLYAMLAREWALGR